MGGREDITHSISQEPVKPMSKVQEIIKCTKISDIVANIRKLVDNDRQVSVADNRVVGDFIIHRNGSGVARCRGEENSIKGGWSLVNFKVLKEWGKLDCIWSLAHFQVTGELTLR